jgi:hypothetical protein
LIPGRRRDILPHAQIGEERRDLVAAHVAWVALAVIQDESLDPVEIGLLGTKTVVVNAQGFANLVHQTWAPMTASLQIGLTKNAH